MGKDSNEIRREIEATRARMGDTVEALGYKADVPSRVKDAVNERVETVKGTIGDAVAGVKDAVGGVTGKVGSALGSATSSVTSTLSDTTQRVGEVTERLPTGEDLENAARRGVGLAAENPLGLALGALAVGFLAGLLAPVTRIERRTVGPIRDDLLERAQSLGSGVIEHGKQVLQETAHAAAQTAQQSAQSHAEDVLSEARGD